MYQIVTWYIFNLYNVLCQFYLNKPGKNKCKKTKKSAKVSFNFLFP